MSSNVWEVSLFASSKILKIWREKYWGNYSYSKNRSVDILYRQEGLHLIDIPFVTDSVEKVRVQKVKNAQYKLNGIACQLAIFD